MLLNKLIGHRVAILKTKTAIMSLIERKGDVLAKVLSNVKMLTIEELIIEHVGVESSLYTDDLDLIQKYIRYIHTNK